MPSPTRNYSPTASADLIVVIDRPGFSKSFPPPLPSTVPLGGRSILTFTIDNSLNPDFALALTFADNLPTGLEIASPANASSTCTFASTPVLTAVPGTSVFSLSAGGVAATSTCTVSVDVVATGGGMLDNVSGELTSLIGIPIPTLKSSGKASATLDVTFDTLHLTKSFTDDPIPPGGTGTLEFTIENFDRFDPATGITFTDDLGAALTSLTASAGPTPAPPCGIGSSLAGIGTGMLTLIGGTVPMEGSCTFTVDLAVPAGAPIGIHTNTTSTITGDIGGSMETGSAASDDLFVQPSPMLTKKFTDDPVGAGGTVTLEFTITNTSLTLRRNRHHIPRRAHNVPAVSAIRGLASHTRSALWRRFLNGTRLYRCRQAGSGTDGRRPEWPETRVPSP